MEVLEKMRNSLFWTLDSLKNNSVKQHFDDIDFILKNYNSSKSRLRRESLLNDYLNHAVSTTPFYKPYKDYSCLSDFPVISKMDIRNAYDQMLSEDYCNKPSSEIATSGTTGIPFRVRQDSNKKNRNMADTFYFGQLGGYTLGDRLYYVRKWVPETSRSPFNLFLTNIQQINVTDFSQEFLEKLTLKMLSDTSNKALIGYASALGDICRYMEFTNKPTASNSFKSIITMAEAVSDNTKEKLQKYFGCPAVARYSNSENGIFAQQLIGQGNDYFINWASYHLEILKLDTDEAAEHGELGRIVITDLFNYCMPLIRYDTGDLGILNQQANAAPVLSKIEGRRMDTIYNTNGEVLSPYVAFEMEYFTELKQFQLIQEGQKEYTAKLNLEGKFENEDKLINRLRKYLGMDAQIHFEYVEEFPQLASGKRRLTINNYNKIN